MKSLYYYFCFVCVHHRLVEIWNATASRYFEIVSGEPFGSEDDLLE